MKKVILLVREWAGDLLSIYIPCISILFVLLCLKTSSAKIRMRITSVSENRTPPTTPTTMTTTGTAGALLVVDTSVGAKLLSKALSLVIMVSMSRSAELETLLL